MCVAGLAHRGTDESRQCRITIADDRDRLTFLPALIGEGGADQTCGLLYHAATNANRRAGRPLTSTLPVIASKCRT
jgi:hypothetical protein